MINLLLMNLQTMFQSLMNREDGQDLVEYALLITLISLALCAAMGAVANDIAGVYGAIEAYL
jgi:Flp pilus assembly pilin Flp